MYIYIYIYVCVCACIFEHIDSILDVQSVELWVCLKTGVNLESSFVYRFVIMFPAEKKNEKLGGAILGLYPMVRRTHNIETYSVI